MDDFLPFPLNLVFLLLVVPIGLVYLVSLAGVGVLVVRRVLNRLISRRFRAKSVPPPST